MTVPKGQSRGPRARGEHESDDSPSAAQEGTGRTVSPPGASHSSDSRGKPSGTGKPHHTAMTHGKREIRAAEPPTPAPAVRTEHRQMVNHPAGSESPGGDMKGAGIRCQVPTGGLRLNQGEHANTLRSRARPAPTQAVPSRQEPLVKLGVPRRAGPAEGPRATALQWSICWRARPAKSRPCAPHAGYATARGAASSHLGPAAGTSA